MARKVKLFLGIPSTGNRSDYQCYVLRELEQRYGDEIEFVYPDRCVHRIFHDFARNATVDEFLASDADILWFLDSDVVPARHVLDLITLHGDKWEAAAAPYPVFMPPQPDKQAAVLFTIYKEGETKGLHPSKIPYEGTEFVDGAATGCLFLKRSVFDKVKAPFFEFKHDPKTRMLTEGEDIGFCKKLLVHNIKTFVDYSMVCKHFKNVCLLDINNYAIQYANDAVTNYATRLKSEVAGTIQGIKEKLHAQYEAKYNPPKKHSGLYIPGL